jgi:aspartyl/asparaginyl beta-hydroxylase (cupin superfamily)
MPDPIREAHSPRLQPLVGKISRPRRGREFIIALGLKILPLLDRVLMWFAERDEPAIVGTSRFAWVRDLEARWPAIAAEARAVLADPMTVPSIREVSPDHAKIAVDGKWRSYFFWGYGIRVDEHCARCPNTAKALSGIPDLLTGLYSVMQAGAHVPRHTGSTKAILTVHMGLVVPRRQDRCWMMVGNHRVTWNQGEVVVFDDMVPHEVWNESGEDRINLMLHIKRPLRFPGTLLRDLLFALFRASPFVRDAVVNLEQWEAERRIGSM